jgi:hypothetical protein
MTDTPLPLPMGEGARATPEIDNQTGLQCAGQFNYSAHFVSNPSHRYWSQSCGFSWR